MSAKQQKHRHRNVPAEDTPYVPPASLRHGLWWKAEKAAEQKAGQGKRAPKEKAPRIAQGPKKSNLRDPIQALGDDVVSLIIAQLPARDTETLRRVSKLWKDHSEYHCGKSALLKHFPWALAKADRCETREAANLQFRRCLYLQESLAAGFATRAIRCDGAYDWHVNDDRLLWGQKKEPPSIRDLRTMDGRSIINPESIKLDISGAMPDRTTANYVQVIPGGFLLTAPLSIKRTVKVSRLSAGGTALWSLDFKAPMTRPVIGKESIYFVHGPYLKNDGRDCAISFAKHRLCDGSVIFDVSMPPATWIRSKMFHYDGSLLLTGSERLVLWGRMSCTDMYIFSTSTGQMLKRIDQRRYRRFSPPPQSVVPSTHTAGFWITSQDRTVLDSYKENSNSFKGIKGYQFDGVDSNDPPFVTFGGDHAVFFHIRHPGVGRGARLSGSTNHFGQLAVLPTAHAPDRKSMSFDRAVPVTLPGRSKADGKRRKFELELPWEFVEGDFFGMMEDYLVCYNRENDFLVLVDFWPEW